MALMVSESTDRLGFLIHDAQRLMRKRFEARAAAHGLSSSQWRLLATAVKGEGVAQARLAELLEIEPISVSRLIDRMEEGGWVERRADATDRRVRMVFPTQKARTIFLEIKAIVHEVYEEAMSGLSTAQRQALIDGLKTVVTNLSDGEVPAAEQKKIPEGAAA